MPASHRRTLAPVGAGHPRVRQFSSIKHNRGPNRRGAVAVEGLWSLRHALDAGVPVEVVFVCPALLRGVESDRAVAEVTAAGGLAYEVSERVLRRMVERDGPDGLAAIVHLPQRSLSDVRVNGATRIVVADSYELAGNLGAVIRSADAAGATAVLVTERRVRVAHPLVLKASMGTVFSMPVIDCDRSVAAAWLSTHGVRTVAADPAAGCSYRDADYGGPVALVTGSERYGLDPFWRDAADAVVSIPMLGRADSLNVGHAAALLLYEALHQQSRRPPSGRGGAARGQQAPTRTRQ